MTKSPPPRPAAGFSKICCLMMMAAFCAGAAAERVDSLARARTLYVGTFTGGAQAAQLRESLLRKLSRSHRFQLVQSSGNADAVVTGTGQIWVRGFVAINPHTPATDRQAVYGGYLSLEVDGAQGQPLWSWLATPGEHVWGSVFDDIAGRAANKLVEAAEPASASPASPSRPDALVKTSLTAAGATFPAPLYQKWFEDFDQRHPGIQIHYDPVGSQAGNDELVQGKLDFAGSDIVTEPAPDAAHLRHFATVLGAVVPIYNIKGVTQDLRFTPETLADIFLGHVLRWNDPEIRRSNKGVNLPDAPIVVVHRSDGSGTTWVLSDFLSKVSPAWSSSVGRGTTLHWPVGNAAEHNEGVAEAVQNNANSIGYVELTYAVQHQLSYAAVRNRAGEFVHADLLSVAEAARNSSATGEPAPSITNPGGRFAYPIASFTWLVLPAQTANAAKKAGLVDLLRWILTSGQKECAALGYAPLPREIVDRQLKSLTDLQ
jgi:phosphate ABC transporter phosphate-binding protein